MENWLGANVPKLGFGFMRLPTDPNNEIDYAQLERMVDAFLDGGFTYFDAAYGYMNERSELAIRRTVVERHPREKFLLATKLPPWHLKEKADMERLFSTQLERTGAGYFDFYLLHSLGAQSVKTIDAMDGWAFARQKKAEGLARHIGFSFHDTADVLDDVLTKHPEMEFVQLQINYADWDDPKIQSRKCYEVARKHGKSVIIMEPVKGGALATLNADARAALEAARPGSSPASWAMRYAASLEGVVTVLSGMSTLEQVRDNVRTISGFEKMTAADYQAIEKAKAIMAAIPTTPCTDCRYCMENCPQNIPISQIIRTDNGRRVYGNTDKGHYAFLTREKGKASDCIACGVCEGRCPQKIEIIELMRACALTFE